MGDTMRYYLEVDRLIREEHKGWLEACEIAKTHYPNLQREIKKDCKSSQINLKTNLSVTDKEKKYNLDEGHVFDEKTGQNVDTTAEDAAKYIFKGWK